MWCCRRTAGCRLRAWTPTTASTRPATTFLSQVSACFRNFHNFRSFVQQPPPSRLHIAQYFILVVLRVLSVLYLLLQQNCHGRRCSVTGSIDINCCEITQGCLGCVQATHCCPFATCCSSSCWASLTRQGPRSLCRSSQPTPTHRRPTPCRPTLPGVDLPDLPSGGWMFRCT